MSEAGITRYCLGTGLSPCDGCQMEANWNMLNQMPAALRTALQAPAQRINATACRLDGRPWYVAPASAHETGR
jgi:hypothetical protein